MKKQKNIRKKPTAVASAAPLKKSSAGKPFGWGKFSFKVAALLAAVVAVVAYTDKQEYFVGDQTNNHVQRKWRSFYRFTDRQKKNVDIVVLGNSHASGGVEPYILSMVTGSNSFILNTPGATLNDAYFNLKEVLRHTKPKLAVIETFCIYGSEIGAEWGRIQSFEAKTKESAWEKLLTMPYLFSSDEWVKAWSPTIRNHSFLLTDTARIGYNVRHVGVEKNPDRIALDLGRFAYGNSYLKDENLRKYDSIGAPVKCAGLTVPQVNQKYLKKISDLCRANNVALMLLTVPMYYKAFSCYDSLRATLQTTFDRIVPDAKWCNLQQPYDTALLTAEAYNNEYSGALHTTSYGMTVSTYKLCDFVLKNYADSLPNRRNDPKWVADFRTQPHYLFCCDAPRGDTSVVSVVHNQVVGGYTVKDLLLKKDKDYEHAILKIANPAAGLGAQVMLLCKVRYKNQISYANLAMQSMRDVFPPQHKVYFATLQKGVEVLEVVGVR